MSDGSDNSGEGAWVCLNGVCLPEAEAHIPASDRSFLYGDGLFETLRVYRGVPFAWRQHMERLEAGAEVLVMACPSPDALRYQVGELTRANGLREAVLRIHLSRGTGRRGYAATGEEEPLCLLTLQELPEAVREGPREADLLVSPWRLTSGNSLAACKSASRQIHVLASSEARRQGGGEALLLNECGDVAEAASANFFWVEGDRLLTPSLESGALAGVTRELVLEIAGELGIAVGTAVLRAADLSALESAFLTSSVREMQVVRSLDRRDLADSPLRRRIHRVYLERVAKECRNVPF